MKVHYIQPYDKQSPPNIGGAINSAIKQLNADPSYWIVLLDHDVLFLRPDSKKQLEEILETTDFDILGPVTNRLAMDYQLHPGAFDEDSITAHVEIANQRHKDYYGQVNSYPYIAAAFCLCFRASVWNKLGGFHENTIQFDSIFCARALNAKMKLGLMVGIYVFHLYRWGSKTPKIDCSHLLRSANQDSPQQ